LAHKAAHDMAVQAEAGLLSVNLGADGQPAIPGVPASDMAASLMALSGILMALFRRETSGLGDYIDMSMYDALLAWTPNVMGPVFAEERAPVVKDERSWGGSSFNAIYACADDRHLALAGGEPKFVKALLTALEGQALIPIALQPPGAAHEPVRAFLRERFAQKTLAQWQALLDPLDLAWAPVRSLHEAINSAHAAARGLRIEQPNGQAHLGLPIKFRYEPGQLNGHLDALGASTQEVLQEAGYTPAQIESLRSAGVLS
jgi:crotonobetainyl-CoA:carnitine CoA-transferase CaiB-like acyl-CoA transferase